MKDKTFYFILGFMLNMIISMIIVVANPTPEAQWCKETEEICLNCGMKTWYFQEAQEVTKDE